ncbi:MAG: glycosyltransferase family 4 protein [Acidobacteriota bacterium]|nr:glycosyltransferase family 4 protein [Acidobacteriota bacterium]
MRLVFLTNTYPPGDISGVGALVYELRAEAARQGHDVYVLTREYASQGDRAVVGLRGPKLLFPLTVAIAFLRRFRDQPPDVVHVHESDGALVAMSIAFARVLGHPLGRSRLVATLQVSYAEERRSVRPILSDGVVVSRPTGDERIFGWVRAPILSLLGRITARLADAVVAPSRATAAELERDYGCRVREVIPNGVFPFSAVETPPRQSSVLYVGRLRTRKAVAVLIEAFALVAGRHEEVTLDLVGSGEQSRALKARVVALGLDARVCFRGAMPRDHLAVLYREAGIFCLPSIYEGFPVAILEAMSTGLPVVATRVAGIPEAVLDGETGYVVEQESATQLADGLARLLEDEALRMRMGAAARRRFDEEYAIDRITTAHLDLFRDLLQA